MEPVDQDWECHISPVRRMTRQASGEGDSDSPEKTDASGPGDPWPKPPTKDNQSNEGNPNEPDSAIASLEKHRRKGTSYVA